MSVVLRCPTCGTAQAHAGECEACSDGEVRYFCTNHDEGVWLDGPVCSRCGATFGAPSRASRPPAASTRPAGPPDFRPPGTSHARGSRSEPDFASRRPRPHTEGEERADPAGLPRTPSLGELLGEMVEERSRRTADYDAADVPWAEPAPLRRPLLPVGGCLLRIAGLALLMIIALIILMFMLFGGLVNY